MENDIHETLLKKAEVKIHGNEEENLKHKLWNESKKMWIVAGPAIFSRFSTFGVNVISQAFIGHIGATELAAFALIITVLVKFTNGLLLGAASGLETICGQAYGARQYHMLGIYLQRSWVVLLLTSTLMLPVFIFAGPIFNALGQDESIANMAGTISVWFIPVIYSYISSFSCQIFLQSQSKNMIISYLAAFSLCIHVFLSWLLTVEYKLGIAGAAVSTILAYWIPNIGQLIFIMCGGCKETWRGFSILAFKDLWPVVKLSLSAGAMVCLEVWYNSILILLTGNLKNAEVEIDALSICLNINGWEMMISFGFLGAASVRIANELGRGDSKAAKFSIAVIVLTSFLIGLVLSIVFFFLRGHLAYIFTDNHEVASEVARLSPLLAFSMLTNSVQPVLSGVAIGAGWQSTVVYVNLGSYYLIGIPLGVVLGYVIKLQVEGVWIGMLTGTLVQTIILVIITCKTDWDAQVIIAKTRVNKWFVDIEPKNNGSEDA
ncbi:protein DETOXIFICATION 21-like [Primulina huaijiensis]|uniref:protein DETOXIFICATION 21-like n=1 Tax=Primulina huaijiensis TaxID=1492673 RepID=UPI003CC7855D